MDRKGLFWSSTRREKLAESVLFVDDEKNILNALERLFSDLDVRVLKAGSGEEALRFFRDEEIAVVVSDNLMPGMKGVELLARIREISPDTVKILMTGYADLSTALEAINRGEVFRFIVKPWEDEVLLNAVQEGIDRFRVIRALKKADEATL